ncbi:MAG: TPM domain-containing protein [Vicinamibacterales bacterium]
MTATAWRVVCSSLVVVVAWSAPVQAQEPPPELTRPVNDFANVIDPSNEAAMDSLVRSLEQASGDVVVVATVETFAPYATLQEYAVEMFENRGRGIGAKGKDNGALVVLAVKDRAVWIEVGYDLEQFITDGFAGETSRQYMVPEFRRGSYGTGLLAGVSRVISRIAEARNVTLQGVRPSRRRDVNPAAGSGSALIIALFVVIIVVQLIGSMLGRGRRRRFHRRGWGGYPGRWHSGVGPFGGGGFGGGGFGGGFGGFGGGRSGGGGGGASW